MVPLGQLTSLGRGAVVRRWMLCLLITAMILPWSALAQDQADPQATISALQTEVARLQGSAATPTLVPATVEVATHEEPTAPTSESATSDAPQIVNLEIILDVSGSMGQIIDTGETRMDAAKRVLNEVMAAIPDDPGVNVGLRIYGHLGDNTEAGRPVSCEASELVVPIAGVDRQAIAQQMAPLFPTGWTPIATSLERSAADFPASEVLATNAVVLVTDGLETCDGDPAAAAASLAANDSAITTHVIGFALTPEEQLLLQSITAASGGMLLEAANATELTGALFTILDELDVVKGAGFIGGSALSLLPPGEPGALSIVAIGPYDGTTLPFVVRNNTGQTMISLSATGSALNAAGQLIATGGDQGLNPNLVRAGGLSLGYIYFGGAALAPDTTFEIEVEGVPADQEQFENQRDLNVVEAAYVDGRVVGTLSNGYTEPLFGPFGVKTACFDQTGALLELESVFAPEEDADSDEVVTFQAPLFGTFDCPLFLVAGGGFSRDFNRKATAILTPEAPAAEPAPTRAETPTPTTSEAAGPAEATATPDEVAVATATSGQTAGLVAPAANGCYDLSAALGVLSGLAAEGIPIGEFVDYTPQTDPNELMGRPGGYTSKVNFQDTRLTPESTDFDTQDGGAIEVFASEDDLNDRIARLEATWEAFPIVPKDVLYSEGTILLRVSTRLLTPDVESYGAALEALATCS